MRYWIVKTATTERVLSGVCYMSEWLYAALAEAGHSVEINEDVTVYGFDKMVKDYPDIWEHEVIIDLSSYPQVELCEQLYRDYRGRMRLSFFGYEPLIKARGLPMFDPAAAGVNVLDGVRAYSRYRHIFRPGDCGDYDSHVVGLGGGRRFDPVFLSVGCDRKCPYCYVGYSNFPHGALSVKEAEMAIWASASKGADIHFYDEDFFTYPHMAEVLPILEEARVKWICLTTSKSLAKAIEVHGVDKIRAAGNILNEIGLETTDAGVLAKQQSLDEILKVPLNYFWLTVTFFPNETLESKAGMGRFLAAHGYAYDQLVPRIRSNSSHGGLGQFFVPYHGTPWFDRIETMGRRYTEAPTRLWPSFIGQRFLYEVPRRTSSTEYDRRWLGLYAPVEQTLSVLDECDGLRTVAGIMGGDVQKGVIIAQLAQLGAVR